ncbi:hypothetical protein KSP40_PGU009243 [Platanthera guangdongensis]|uniref:Uncharacterized protein n=1 Tax=Platanthera guangdongensis TaxID=2320717 RepID=A0ABR2LZ24_9ASPA
MPREADGKLTTSPGICHALFRFFVKHFSFYASKTVTSGSRRSESSKRVCREEADYEVAIEHVLIRDMQEEEEKMTRKMRSEEARGGEKSVMRKKPSMAKKGIMTEQLRLESSIDEKSGSFIKKRKEVFFS